MVDEFYIAQQRDSNRIILSLVIIAVVLITLIYIFAPELGIEQSLIGSDTDMPNHFEDGRHF
jgi:hypothetical protein